MLDLADDTDRCHPALRATRLTASRTVVNADFGHRMV
jgi:hypothetical protein